MPSMKKLKIVYNNSLKRILNLFKCNGASEMLANPNYNDNDNDNHNHNDN